MLVLTRKVHEAIRIGTATVTVVDVGSGKVRIGVDAPDDVKILRTELLDGGRYGAAPQDVDPQQFGKAG